MKISAMLGVLDENTLLPMCVDHLYAIGVDTIIVIDEGSTDGTLDWLHKNQGEKLSFVSTTDEQKADHHLWEEVPAALTRASDADWIVYLDADEFWLPPDGSIRSYLEQFDPGIDVIHVDRFNVALTAEGVLAPWPLVPENYPDIWMYPKPLQNYRKSVEEDGVPWIRGVPAKKIAARPHRLEKVGLGFHDGYGQKIRSVHVKDILVAHFAFSTEMRFQQKVANIKKTFQNFPNNLPSDAGWHWRRWASMLDNSADIAVEYRHQQIMPEQVAVLEQQGILINASTYFKQYGGDKNA